MPSSVIDVTRFDSTDGFIVRGSGPLSSAGASVSSAGDINGDGIDDLIVSAPRKFDGVAYVIYGKLGGRPHLDVASLTPGDGFIIQASPSAGGFEFSVSKAGDVNGDGIDDLIVGTPKGDAGGYNAGQAYVIYGKSTATRSDIALASLASSDGFIIQGDADNDQAGFDVANAGDVNGDGIDDVIVSALYSDSGGTNSGSAYVVFGVLGSRGTIDLATLGSGDGFLIKGGAANDYAGRSIAAAGDVNNDGFDDIVIGVLGADFGGVNAGGAYVIFGRSGTRATVDLGNLAVGDALFIQGDAPDDRAGFSVSGAGDVNGDGIDDFIVGAFRGDDGGYNAGEAYVLYGRNGLQGAIDLSALSISDGFIIRGDSAYDSAGFSVAAAGDINGDGIGDVLVGARSGTNGGPNAGEAYLIYGRTGTRSNLDLTALAPADGFIVQGNNRDDLAGTSVSAAGDVNGDGIDDIIVGAPEAGVGSHPAGEAYVIYGAQGGVRGNFLAFDLTDLFVSDGFVIQGDASGDYTGFSVASAGDINGDGFEDLLVASPFGGNSTVFLSGEVYVIFGRPGTRGRIDLTNLSPTDGFMIRGHAIADFAGWSVSDAGDVNADGLDDIVIGARKGDDGGQDAGEAYVIFGKAGPTRATIDLGNLAASDGFIIQGDVGQDYAGTSVSGAGDINGDGIGDLIVGAPGGDDGGGQAGEAYVVYGRAGTRTTVDLTALAPTDGFVIQGDAAGDMAGLSVSDAGDINGDGIGDLLVGARFGDNGGTDAGEVYVVYGKAGPRASLDLTSFSTVDGFIVQGGPTATGTGVSVSAVGDVNDDGIDDIIIGAGNKAFVIYGKNASTRSAIDLTSLAASDGFMMLGGPSEAAGVSVAAAGDVNGDGIGDLIVGAPYSYGSSPSEGKAYIIYGKSGSNRAVLDLDRLRIEDGFVVLGDERDDNAGRAVSGAGDINGDGIDDIVVGAHKGDDGGGSAGEAYVIYGRLTAGAMGGTSTDDFLTGTSAADAIYGLAGNDLLYGDLGNDRLFGADGSDALFGQAGDDILSGGSGQDKVDGGADNDSVSGGADGDSLRGGDGDDVLDGGSGIDAMNGGAGIDIFTGGEGRDKFRFGDGDSGNTIATADRITDFDQAQGERISLTLMDAIVGGADDAFTFIGTAAFGNIAGQLRYELIDGNTYVMGDTNGDGASDFMIRLDGALVLTGADFSL